MSLTRVVLVRDSNLSFTPSVLTVPFDCDRTLKPICGLAAYAVLANLAPIFIAPILPEKGQAVHHYSQLESEGKPIYASSSSVAAKALVCADKTQTRHSA